MRDPCAVDSLELVDSTRPVIFVFFPLYYLIVNMTERKTSWLLVINFFLPNLFRTLDGGVNSTRVKKNTSQQLGAEREAKFVFARRWEREPATLRIDREFSHHTHTHIVASKSCVRVSNRSPLWSVHHRYGSHSSGVCSRVELVNSLRMECLDTQPNQL